MEPYEHLEMEIIEFAAKDIIIASGGNEWPEQPIEVNGS